MATRPEALGLSGARLARIDAHLKNRYVDLGKIAGALTLVARRGEIAHLSPVGMMDLERGLPMAEDTLFRIYSMTKPVTSVALMMLYEHGHLQLTDPVHKFIPSWRNLRVFRMGNHPNFLTEPCQRAMTVRDLLTHTSGLTYGFLERTNVDAAYRKLGIGAWGRQFDGSVGEIVIFMTQFMPSRTFNFRGQLKTIVYGAIVDRA